MQEIVDFLRRHTPEPLLEFGGVAAIVRFDALLRPPACIFDMLGKQGGLSFLDRRFGDFWQKVETFPFFGSR